MYKIVLKWSINLLIGHIHDLFGIKRKYHLFKEKRNIFYFFKILKLNSLSQQWDVSLRLLDVLLDAISENTLRFIELVNFRKSHKKRGKKKRNDISLQREGMNHQLERKREFLLKLFWLHQNSSMKFLALVARKTRNRGVLSLTVPSPSTIRQYFFKINVATTDPIPVLPFIFRENNKWWKDDFEIQWKKSNQSDFWILAWRQRLCPSTEQWP